MEQNDTFACAFNCMDGRCQEQVGTWLKQYAGVAHIDTITEPGVDALLAGTASDAFTEWLRAKAAISAEKHGARTAAVVGHMECAGNPVPREEHAAHITDAVNAVTAWHLFDDVVGLLVNEKWEVERIV